MILEFEVKGEKEKSRLTDAITESLKNLSNAMARLDKISHGSETKKINVSETDLFETTENCKIINGYYLIALKYIDLSLVSFENVNVEGIDFKNCNINFAKNFFDPQIVYGKSLRNCKLYGICGLMNRVFCLLIRK